ncbi:MULTISPECIES: iron uptake porin [unclassified Cyanobium]|uniref:iron uptake porin n=1 Tax=unclassified Cyanobium TaxID=2627006 RepID=UPI0020CC11CF|nr:MULTISPECIES: iron uptake porin [unclassified Cyanobium]MCP9777637.1 carbohydrate porin [Cyanobium sp. Tous-M-B4]MCP9877000.1 carbohydrate porin [Cyanobium sp. A2C-AMD]
MNLSKKLLLALAGTGMMAPMAASAQELASLNGAAAVNEYMQQQDVDRFRAWESKNQVTSVTQFSDVQPTDWAYQALSNLVEKYGCVAGYPNGTYKGGQAMTRYEAAALLNACLDRVTEVTDELQRLMEEFKAELATLRGRVDGLEKKVGVLEAQQFSTTTKLRGEVSMIIGGSPNYDGDGSTKTTFNYDVRLSFDTSFTGKDLLRTRLRSGNFLDDPFGSSGNVFKLDKAEENAVDGGNAVSIDRLFYTFPVGNEVKLTVGALARNTEMLTFLPTAYKSDILDFFNLAGATGTYNKATGAAAGLSWKQKVKKGNPFVSFDVNWVSQDGGEGDGFANSQIGAFESEGAQNILAQLGVKGQNWGAAVAYRYGSENARLRDPNSPSSDFFRTVGAGQDSNSVSLAGFWEPMDAKWLPSISGGFSYTNYTSGDTQPSADIWSWMVGLQWKDVFAKGNSAGFAVGSPLYVTSSSDNGVDQTPGYMYELFYRFRVSDNISVTPAVFWITKNYNDGNAGEGTYGGVIQTTFRF